MNVKVNYTRPVMLLKNSVVKMKVVFMSQMDMNIGDLKSVITGTIRQINVYGGKPLIRKPVVQTFIHTLKETF